MFVDSGVSALFVDYAFDEMLWCETLTLNSWRSSDLPVRLATNITLTEFEPCPLALLQTCTLTGFSTQTNQPKFREQNLAPSV